MLLVASVSVLAFLMCACGNEEPAANAGEETSRTDQPTVEKEDGAEEKDLDGTETFPETDHLFKDDDVFTEFGVSGGKKTIVYNFRSQPYFSFATSEDLLTKDADGKIKVAKTDREFVGIKSKNNQATVTFPIGYNIKEEIMDAKETKKVRKVYDDVNVLMKVLEEFKDSRYKIGEDEFCYSSGIFIIENYLKKGLYNRQ